MDWEGYQEEVAKLFRELGCSAEVNAKVKGVRAEHDIDVWVTFNKFGFTNYWAIECKYWKTRIPKEKILTLKSIIEDIGADKGIIISEVGFQRGAINAAKQTNIILKRFEDLKSQVKNDFYANILNKIENKVYLIRPKIMDLFTHEIIPNGMKSMPKTGIDGLKL